MSRWYITVSIPYVNAAPHVGYALELVRADVLARSRRQAGDEVRFLGGTDDNSLKNVLAARQAGLDTARYVEHSAQRFAELARPLRISFDDFIHTGSDPRHRPGVEHIWRRCAAKGDFYRHLYEGSYCVGCEQYFTDEECDGRRCPEHGTPLEQVSEENWFFRLSRYAAALREAISSGQLAIEPEPSRNEVLSFLSGPVADVSVSRAASRAHGWGIPVPDDPEQVIYVWWEALSNYITALGFGSDDASFRKWWLEADERVHLIGKGIVRFHALYWPALLLSAGLPLPTRLEVHPYLTVDGAKISKSRGNGADPVELVDRYGADALRWWLCRDVSRTGDADFSEARLVTAANEDLANGLGNLTSRVARLAANFRSGTGPRSLAPDADAEVVARSVELLEETVAEHIAGGDLRAAVSSINEAVTACNRSIEHTRPWELERAVRRVPGSSSERLDALLGFLVETVAGIASAARPLIPDGAARVADRLGARGEVPRSDAVAFVRLDSTPPATRTGAPSV